MKRAICCNAVALVFLAAGSASSAHDESADSSGTQPSSEEQERALAELKQLMLEDITTTAQKRPQNLQEVPVSAEVIGRDELAQRNINSLEVLAQTDPSVAVLGTIGRSGVLSIRGINSGNNAGFEQSVAVFIDDIYHGRAHNAAAVFLDLDRVEILKGPQSTFFGNNAIAGAFNIVTRQPDNTFGIAGRALYGMFGQYGVESALNVPVNDKLAIRVAGTVNGERGWLKNLYTGNDQPHQINDAARVTARFTPDDQLDANLKIETGRNRNFSGFFSQFRGCPPPAPLPVNVLNQYCSVALQLGMPLGDYNDESAITPQQIYFDTNEDVLTVHLQRWGHTLTSISGFYNYDYHLNLNTAFLPVDEINAHIPERYHQFSQELLIASPKGRRFEYIAGIYLQTDHLAGDTDLSYFQLTPTIQSLRPFAPLVPFLPLGQELGYRQGERSQSLYGSVGGYLTSALQVTAGIRGTWVHKDFNWNLFYGTAAQEYGDIVPLPAAVALLPAALKLGTPGNLSLSRSDRAWTPSATVTYHISPGNIAYISYTSGFKSGGFNTADNSAVAANLPYGPEYVSDYEAGLKSEFWQKRVRVALAAFRGDYRDLQVSANFLNNLGTFISVVRNAARSRSTGLEFQGEFAFSRRFRLAFSGTYMNAYYVSYPNVTGNSLQKYQGQQLVDLSGRVTDNDLKWSGRVSGTYRQPLPGGRFVLTTELISYLSSPSTTASFFGPTNADRRLDARISLGPDDERWNVDLLGQNLTNQRIGPPSFYNLREAPASVLLQARYRW
jgi:iron complex outermembrane recepter protein